VLSHPVLYVVIFGISMSETIIGKLREKLVIETDQDGEPTIVVIPKGAIVEVSSEDEYPSTTTDEDIKDAVEYLKEQE